MHRKDAREQRVQFRDQKAVGVVPHALFVTREQIGLDQLFHHVGGYVQTTLSLRMVDALHSQANQALRLEGIHHCQVVIPGGSRQEAACGQNLRNGVGSDVELAGSAQDRMQFPFSKPDTEDVIAGA